MSKHNTATEEHGNGSIHISELKDIAREAGNRIGLAISNVSDHAGEFKSSVEGQVKSNPFKAVGLALGAGVALGLLISMRKAAK